MSMEQSQIDALGARIAAAAAAPLQLNPAELKVETILQQLGGFAPITTSGVRVTHTPTGIVVEETQAFSQHANRAAALQKLAELVAKHRAEGRHALQAEGKHPAPCAKFCEATAFEIEARGLKRQIAELQAQRDELLAALQGMLNIVNDSRGVAGYHLNGDTAEWDEFDEVDAAEAVIARLKPRNSENPVSE